MSTPNELPTENPVRKGEARAELKWGRTKFSAVCRALGMRGRHVMVSRLRKFVEDNPGFVTNSVYRRDTQTPSLRIKPKGKRFRVEMVNHPEIFEEAKELSDALVSIAPRVKAYLTHKN